MNRQRFKLSPLCWLETAADFVDYIVKKAQVLIICNYKVVEHGKTNPTQRDDVNTLKNPGPTTNTALEAIASSSGKNRVNWLTIDCMG